MATTVSNGLNETMVAKATKRVPATCGATLQGLANLIKSGAVNEIRTGILLNNFDSCLDFHAGLFFPLPSFTNEYGEHIDTTNLYLYIDSKGEETICHAIGCDKYFDFYLPLLDGKTTDGRKIIDGGVSYHSEVIEELANYGLADTYLDNYYVMLLRPWHKQYIEVCDPEVCHNLLHVMNIPYIAEHLAKYGEE